MSVLQNDIRYLKGVGEKRAEQFAKLGVKTLGALLSYYPRDYVDYSNPFTIASAPYDTPCAIKAAVYAKGPAVRIGAGRTMQKITVADETATLTLTFFNNPYVSAALETEKEYLFYGRVEGPLTRREMVSPVYLKANTAPLLAAVYPLTQGLRSAYISKCVQTALAELQAEDWRDPLPLGLQEQFALLPHKKAVEQIHFPSSLGMAQAARKRLIFEELLVLQLGLLSLRGRQREQTAVCCPKIDFAPFWSSLSFTPTLAQKRCANEIAADLQGPLPMNRLLQGDVGSGKTLVAAAAILQMKRGGYQSALMAPTEILAAQHAETLHAMLSSHGVRVVLFTAAVKGPARKAVLAAIANGEADLVVGTHALLGEAVCFAKLGLTVTDEQHRFGVRQRALLAGKGKSPHLLVMSATPIPRTLALIIFGDLDISVLDEMPKGRTAVKTYRIGERKRADMFGFIAKQVQSGKQAYIVCPLIEEGEGEMQAVTTYCEQIAKPLLSHARIGLLHGKMKSKDKSELMRSFKEGSIDVLCSTTVVEVGVDVPNATLMVIENAERYGLSALHQLRGRVGRGAAESYCILVSDHVGEAVQKRLSFFCRTFDGFAIAKYDLETRGPGDFFGNRQHGLPKLKIADLAADTVILSQTQAVAAQIAAEDPLLANHAQLKLAVEQLFYEDGAAQTFN